MLLRSLVLIVALWSLSTLPGADQKYMGPRPPKPDVPYLMHADNLIEPESLAAKQEDHGKDSLAWVPGESSPIRTPLAEPIFLFESQKIDPNKLELYKFDVKHGRREVVFGKKERDSARPLRLMVKPLEGKLYRIEANEFLENGDYALSPDGSDQVFCFQVY
jgi:hypothetical protein